MDQYDFVFGDAFNDLSIPYHLTTKEFDEHVKRLMTPDGLFMALVIDNVGKGQFLPCYLKTLQAVFGEANVALIVLSDTDLDKQDCSTVICVAGKQALDMKDFQSFLDLRRGEGKRPDSYLVSAERLNKYLTDRRRPGAAWFSRMEFPYVLTDDYVPVDNLTAPMFEERYGYRKEEEGKKN
jgi:hypothetical protein